MDSPISVGKLLARRRIGREEVSRIRAAARGRTNLESNGSRRRLERGPKSKAAFGFPNSGSQSGDRLAARELGPELRVARCNTCACLSLLRHNERHFTT